MREIEFRGKRKDNGEWVYGNLLIDVSNGDCTIIQCENYHIDVQNCKLIYKETLGQYTGLKDKNDVKIFEGDILIFNFTYRPRDKGKRKVVFEEGAFQAICNGGYMPLTRNFPNLNSETLDAEVVGNIHDTPELLNRKE